jgi:iron-sulfur cluster assembly protein
LIRPQIPSRAPEFDEFFTRTPPIRPYFLPMISISPQASDALKALLAEKQADRDAGLRLAVRRGGCAGWQYEMKIASPEPDDQVVECDGGRLIVDSDSREKLRDCLVDYEDSLSDAGFRIRNPQAARSCGCGTSFEAAGEAPPEPSEVGDCGKP